MNNDEIIFFDSILIIVLIRKEGERERDRESMVGVVKVAMIHHPNIHKYCIYCIVYQKGNPSVATTLRCQRNSLGID